MFHNCGGTFGIWICGDVGDLGDVGVGGRRIAGTCGVGGVPGLSAVGDGGLEVVDLREEAENNRERLLLIFNDRCGITPGLDGIAVDR